MHQGDVKALGIIETEGFGEEDQSGVIERAVSDFEFGHNVSPDRGMCLEWSFSKEYA
jgi:hypothetical protein